MNNVINKRDINFYVIKFYINELLLVIFNSLINKNEKIFLNKYNSLIIDIQEKYIKDHEYLVKVFNDVSLVKNFNIYIVNTDGGGNEKVIGILDNSIFTKLYKLLTTWISNGFVPKNEDEFKNIVVNKLKEEKIINFNLYNLDLSNKNINIFDIYNMMRNKYDFIPVLDTNNGKKNFIGEIAYSTMLKVIYELFLKEHELDNKIFNLHMFDIIKENYRIFENISTSIFLLKVDNIKFIKEFYGYKEYIETIKKIVDLIIYNLRKIDYIFYNKEKDTFIILLVNTNKVIANRVKTRIEEKLVGEKDNITSLLELEFKYTDIYNTTEDNITIENAYFQLLN